MAALEWVWRLETMRRSNVQATRIVGECEGEGVGLGCLTARAFERWRDGTRGHMPALACPAGLHWIVMRGTVDQCLDVAREVSTRYGPERYRQSADERFRALLRDAHDGRLFDAGDPRSQWLTLDGYAVLDRFEYGEIMVGTKGYGPSDSSDAVRRMSYRLRLTELGTSALTKETV